MIYCFM